MRKKSPHGWCDSFIWCLTFTVDESIMFVPVQFKTVETDHVLQIHQNNHKRVQLISQPEVCEPHAMKWSCHNSELWEEEKQTEWKERSKWDYRNIQSQEFCVFCCFLTFEIKEWFCWAKSHFQMTQQHLSFTTLSPMAGPSFLLTKIRKAYVLLIGSLWVDWWK